MTDQTQNTVAPGGDTPQWELIHFEYLWRARLPTTHEKYKTHFAARAYLYKDNELTKEMVVWPVSKKSRAWIDKPKNDGDVWAFCQHATHGFTLREVALTRKKGRSPPSTPPTTPFAPPTPYAPPSQSPYQFAPGSPYPFAPVRADFPPQAMPSAVQDDVRQELQELRAKTLRQEQQMAQMALALAEVMKRLSVDDEDDNNIRD